jgi:hypothetical protein
MFISFILALLVLKKNENINKNQPINQPGFFLFHPGNDFVLSDFIFLKPHCSNAQ